MTANQPTTNHLLRTLQFIEEAHAQRVERMRAKIEQGRELMAKIEQELQPLKYHGARTETKAVANRSGS